MKLAIMQPYFFPFIGYFQLIAAVDRFVIYDDVNFIKQGWINRNYSLLKGRKHLFTLELKGSSSFTPINQVRVGGNREKLLKMFLQSYAKAPYFRDVSSLLHEIFSGKESNLVEFITRSIFCITEYLDFKTEFVIASSLKRDNTLKGEERVLSICKLLDASIYINAIGGQKLYSQARFLQESIELWFLKSRASPYRQFSDHFIPDLSIIDVLMFNSKSQVTDLLSEYDLVL